MFWFVTEVNVNETFAPSCSYQEKFILDNHSISIFGIYYHEDTPFWGEVRRVSSNLDSQHPIEKPSCSVTQRR